MDMINNRTKSPAEINDALSDAALDAVSGGIAIVKRTDTSSSDLFLKAASAKHDDTAN